MRPALRWHADNAAGALSLHTFEQFPKAHQESMRATAVEGRGKSPSSPRMRYAREKAIGPRQLRRERFPAPKYRCENPHRAPAELLEAYRATCRSGLLTWRRWCQRKLPVCRLFEMFGRDAAYGPNQNR